MTPPADEPIAAAPGAWRDSVAPMSPRDYFAGQAAAPLIAYFDQFAHQYEDLPVEAIARMAYSIADAMLAERAKP